MGKKTVTRPRFQSSKEKDKAKSINTDRQEKNTGGLLAAGKHVLFSLIIVGGFFAGLEFFLAVVGVKPILLTEDPLVGFSSNVPLFVEQRDSSGRIVLRTAKNKLDRFNDQVFPKVKGENTYRIFTVGGSTTYGRPFNHKVSFGGWLQAFLEAAEPGTNWEVINAGGSSYASYRVAKLMQELVRYEPDLFIVYSGHNEFLENRSYGKLADLPAWVIELDSMLSGTRTYSGMKRLYDYWRPESLQRARKRYELSGEVDAVLNYTIGPTSYHRDDELRGQIADHYRLNLERMALVARDAGAEIIFVTPAENLKDFSPFKSEHRTGLSDDAKNLFNRFFEQGDKLYVAGKLHQALDEYRKALDIDERVADLHFRIGQVLFELKNYREAEKAFWRAVDEDVAPLRMLSSLQKNLVDVADSHDVPLVDFQQILKQVYLQNYGQPVPGSEFFLDHVHASIEGYRILGLELFNELADLGIVSSDDTLSATQIETVTRRVTSSLTSVDHNKSLFQLAKVLDWAGKFDAARTLYLRHLEVFGPAGDVYAQLGMVSAKMKNDAEAIDYLQKAIDAGYRKPDVFVWLANTYRNQGDHSKAVQAYKDKLEVDGNKVEAYTFFGIQHALQGDNEPALEEFKKALQLDPDFLPARRNLVITLFALNEYERALARGKAILKTHPDEFRIHYVVGAILLQKGQANEAKKYFSQALELAPEFKEAQDGLKKALKISEA